MDRVAKRLICIGDLHGHLDKARRLWEQLQRRLGSTFDDAKVVFLGDYVDRGPDPRGVIEWLLSLPAAHPEQVHVYLAGNHEFAMSAFLGLLRPEGLDRSALSLRHTWESFIPLNPDERAHWWRPPSLEAAAGIRRSMRQERGRRGELEHESHPLLDAMHLQGRRWGGRLAHRYDSVYSSASTFRSYGVEHGDREGLLRAMPESHKAFLEDLEYVHEAEVEDPAEPGRPIRVVAVHAGFEEEVEEDWARARKRDPRSHYLEYLSGRENVVRPPSWLHAQHPKTFLVSGHHGFLHIDLIRRRIIIDEGGGHLHNPICAIVFPSLEIVKDVD